MTSLSTKLESDRTKADDKISEMKKDTELFRDFKKKNAALEDEMKEVAALV